MVLSILREEGYGEVRTAGTAAEALQICREWRPEFAILDVMLPDGNGFSLFGEMKQIGGYSHAVSDCQRRGRRPAERPLGAGADDYMVKPFLGRELIFRVGAILRRCYRQESPLVKLKGSSLDFERAEVLKGGERIRLTAKEYEILQALYRNAGKIVTIDQLCEAAWGDNLSDMKIP